MSGADIQTTSDAPPRGPIARIAAVLRRLGRGGAPRPDPAAAPAAAPPPVRVPGRAGAPGTARRRSRFVATRSEVPPAGRVYSLFVRAAKVALPIVAVGLFLLVFAWPQLDWQEDALPPGTLEVRPEDAENLRMTSARFIGVDSGGRPFTVTADEANQSGGETGPVHLVKPQGDLTLRDGAWVTLSAERGIYHRNDESLELFGGVTLFHDDGYELSSERARIDLKGGSATGDRPVSGHGPLGEIEGEGFLISDGGDTIIVLGKARLIVRAPADTDGPETGR